MRKVLFITALSLWIFSDNMFSKAPVYLDPKANVSDRVEDLLGRMTLKEKVLQLNMYVHPVGNLNLNPHLNNFLRAGGNFPAEAGSYIYFETDPAKRNELQRQIIRKSRLGIPALFCHDVIHGYNTIYTIPLGQACSWNPKLVEETAAMSAREARSSGIDLTFSPMVDTSRDGRWGRISESYGEDTYTNSVFGAATVRGYQGDDLSSPTSMAACMKHMAGYGAVEAGRDYQMAEISRYSMWNTYLPPFRDGIEAGAVAVMSGLHEVNGIPASADPYTLTHVLRDMWGFEGLVISDWDSVGQLKDYNHTATDYAEASLQAIMAGVDIDLCGGNYSNALDSLVSCGAVPAWRIDDAVRKVLALKFRMGLFENPYTPETPRTKRLFTPESRLRSEQMAEQTCVLLKNDNNVLPAKVTRIAVIGPTQDDRYSMIGDWNARVDLDSTLTLKEALRNEFNGKAELVFARGCDFEGNDTTGFAEARRIASEADMVLLCMGEKGFWSGENKSRADIALPRIQCKLIEEMHATRRPVALLLSSGRPVALGNVEPMLDAILAIWQPGSVGANAVAGIVSGRVNPSGKLAVTFPRHTGQLPLYYCPRRGGRYSPMGDYKDMESTPLFPFGHGLSYTTYKYGPLHTSSEYLTESDTVTLSVDVTNTGDRDGMETVHWFVSDVVASGVQPFRLLKYFEKKEIPAGKTVTFKFTVYPMRDLSFLDSDGTRRLEDGDFIISAANQQIRIKLKK